MYGGAIYARDVAAFEADRCTFLSNGFGQSLAGGAIYAHQHAILAIYGSHFAFNRASQGGAIRFASVVSFRLGSSLIMMPVTQTVQLRIHDTSFVSNEAVDSYAGGGAVLTDNANG